MAAATHVALAVEARKINQKQTNGHRGQIDNTASSHNLESSPTRKRVAIIGSGCAGFGAAYALRHSDYEVHIFEKSPRLGGHTNTQIWTKAGRSTPVDTGFIVMNTATYPNFINFLKDIGLETKITEMSFAVSRDHGKFEWSGSLKGIFAQRRNFFRPSHWRMILDIIRFEQFAPDLLRRTDEGSRSITIGQYLDREGYSQAFKDNYLIPMTAAVWSTSPDKASLRFPAQTLIRFMWNHHLLSTVSGRPDWLTIPGASQQYIDAVVKSYTNNRLRIHRSAEVVGVIRGSAISEAPIRLYWRTDETIQAEEHMTPARDATFSHVIFACHGDQILPILTGQQQSKTASMNGSYQTSGSRSTGASVEEHEIFSCFQTTENECYLHSDLSLMPTRRDTWSSWNYLIESTPSKLAHPAGVSLTYDMNILQHIPTDVFGDVLVTMNPKAPPNPRLTQGQYTYEHPLYTVEAVRAQERLESLQNKGCVSYCGAWTKYGFHEDGFSSGLKVAVEHLDAKLPFEFKDSTYSRGHVPPEPLLLDHALRTALSMIVIVVRLVELVLALPGISLIVGATTFIASYMLDLAEDSGLFA